VTVEYQRRRFALPLGKSRAHRKEPIRHRMVIGEETPTAGGGSPALRESPSDVTLAEPAIATPTAGSIHREAVDHELTKPTTTSQGIGQPPAKGRAPVSDKDR
jgi:hypothetical protein